MAMTKLDSTVGKEGYHIFRAEVDRRGLMKMERLTVAAVVLDHIQANKLRGPRTG